jgi:hypothetical protein
LIRLKYQGTNKPRPRPSKHTKLRAEFRGESYFSTRKDYLLSKFFWKLKKLLFEIRKRCLATKPKKPSVEWRGESRKIEREIFIRNDYVSLFHKQKKSEGRSGLKRINYTGKRRKFKGIVNKSAIIGVFEILKC